MPWDGSGGFSRTDGTHTGSTAWQDASAAGDDILASTHDTHDQDLADGIAACLAKNGENAPTADFKPNADAAYSLGSSAKRWINLFLSGFIGDSSGNELLKFSKASSAVNELTVGNAATGSAPSLAATGGDTDIDVELTPKGAGKATENGGAIMPTGAIVPYAGSSAPTGWLLCDGSAVSRTTYANLFTAISTTYGVGDGSTTFNVPDCTGRAIFGKESSASRLTSGVSGVDGGTLGATGGDQNAHHATISITDPGHNHPPATKTYFQTASATGSGFGSGSGYTEGLETATGSATTGITAADDNTGSSQNVQPTIVLNYIIKT